ncbi:hypothetical protein AB3X52_01135 [Nocardioides sp. DS6]|uniref:Uncharacterized protein n=1 Tax=Nocardioides eburneus TaxID=3231482 RepID=A0ABV3STE3_9ACTN
MASEKNQSFVVENGVTLGVIVLALFVIFAVGLPRWIGSDSESSVPQSAITLPSSISSSYLPAEKAATWSDAVKSKELTQDNATSIQQQATQMAAQTTKNAKTLGRQATTKMYVDVKKQAILVVSAVRSRDAFVSGLTGTLEKVGSSVCQSGTDSSGATAVQCARTDDDLTVQVQAQGGTPTTATVAKYVDEVWDKVA